MKQIEVASLSKVPAEIIGEQEPIVQTALISQALLSGLHIPFSPNHMQALQIALAHATPERLPTRAINTVSTKERQYFDQQFTTQEERSKQHEYWLGEIASRVMLRAGEKKYHVAYAELFGIPFAEIAEASQAASSMFERNDHSIRRGKDQSDDFPEATRALVDRYKEYLTCKKEKGVQLSLSEENKLENGHMSKELVSTAITFELLKTFIHEDIYEPFLKQSTDSFGLSSFMIDKYRKSKKGRISVIDISQKAQLLHEDLDDMTGTGNTMVGLIRAHAVLSQNSQQKEATLMQQAQPLLTPEQSKELLCIATMQHELDSYATARLFEDVHGMSRQLFTMVTRVEENVSGLTTEITSDDFARRTQYIESTYLEPLLSQASVFTTDFYGRAQKADAYQRVLMAHLSDLLSLQQKLPSSIRTYEYLIQTLKNFFPEGSSQSNILDWYEKKRKKQNTSSYIPELIQKILWEMPPLKSFVQKLNTEQGFIDEEIQYLVQRQIEQAWNGRYLFDQYGLSLHGTKVQDEWENRDKSFIDTRYNFLMVADGVGDQEGGSLAAALTKSACSEVLQTMWEKEIRYPYITEDQAKIALREMVEKATEKIHASLPDSVRDYLFGNKDVLDPKTNRPMEPHPEAIDTFYQTTFTGMLPYIKNNRTYVAVTSVGDSRAYVVHKDGTLSQLSRDNSLLWSYLSDFEESAYVLDMVLNRFDKDIPVHTDKLDGLVAALEALQTDVAALSQEVKETIVGDTIECLSKNLRFTRKTLRSSADESIKELLLLQEFLGNSVEDGIDNTTLTLDEKVAAIASYFYRNRNLVSKFIGILPEDIDTHDITIYEVLPEDTFYLTTDGFHDSVSQSRFLRVATSDLALKEKVKELHKETLACLGCTREKDNKIQRIESGVKSARGKDDDGITILAQTVNKHLVKENAYDDDVLLQTVRAS